MLRPSPDRRNCTIIPTPSIPLMRMELRDLEYFAVIAQHGHLGRAADALGLGQPALSMSLRRLERSAQAKLVARTPKGVQLTRIGQALLSHLSRLQLARDDLAREVADLARGYSGHLRIGASPSNAELFLPEACSVLLGDAPGVSLNIAMLDNEALLPALRRGDLDMVLRHAAPIPQADLVDEPFRQDEFVIYCSKAHRLARRKAIGLEDLARERWASTTAAAGPLLSLPETFAKAGLPPPRTALVSDLVMFKLRVVAGSDLLGISNRRTVLAAAAHLRLTILSVKGLQLERTVAVTYRKDAYLPAAARRLIEILKEKSRHEGRLGR